MRGNGDSRLPDIPEDGPGGLEDEPTLETGGQGGEDEEPTLETETQGVDQDGTEETQTRTDSAWGSRLERMTAAKRDRRRRLMNRFWLVAVPVLILVAIAMILLAIYGGQEAADSGSTTTVTVPSVAAAGSAVLLVEDNEALAAAVILQPWEGGGVVFVVPGVALFESEGRFATLAELYGSEGSASAKDAMASAFGIPLGPGASADWEDLRVAMGSTGQDATAIDLAAMGRGESFAQAVRGLVAEHGIEGSPGVWDELLLDGDKAAFLDALTLDAASMVEDVWSAGALQGVVVDGDGYWYLEPDIESARALLVVSDEPVIVSVEVKDGAGIQGAARSAGSLLEAVGFVLGPMSYAEGYPGVERTEILVAAESAAEAQKARSALGVGDIVVDPAIAADLVIVVLGKDYEAVATTTTEPAEQEDQ